MSLLATAQRLAVGEVIFLVANGAIRELALDEYCSLALGEIPTGAEVAFSREGAERLAARQTPTVAREVVAMGATLRECFEAIEASGDVDLEAPVVARRVNGTAVVRCTLRATKESDHG